MRSCATFTASAAVGDGRLLSVSWVSRLAHRFVCPPSGGIGRAQRRSSGPHGIELVANLERPPVVGR